MFALHGHRPRLDRIRLDRIRFDLVLIIAVAFLLAVLASALSGSPAMAVRLVIAAVATTLVIDRIDDHSRDR